MSYEPIRDDVLGLRFDPVCMKACPHPGLINKYGVGGKANVSVYTCRKCRFVVKEYGGVKCGFTTENLTGGGNKATN